MRKPTHAHVPTRGSGGMSPRKILNLDPLRLLSGTRLLFNTRDKTIATILNFNISWGGGGGGGGEFQPPPVLNPET